MENIIKEYIETADHPYKNDVLNGWNSQYVKIRPLPKVTKELKDDDVIKAMMAENNVRVYAEMKGHVTSDSEETWGQMQLGWDIVYFVVTDDPGSSGYECCGAIYMDYCFTVDDLIQLGMTDSQKKEFVKMIKQKAK